MNPARALSVAVVVAGLAVGCTPDPAEAFRVGACVDHEIQENVETLTVVDCAGVHDFVIAAIDIECPAGTVQEFKFGTPDQDGPPLRYCLT